MSKAKIALLVGLTFFVLTPVFLFVGYLGAINSSVTSTHTVVIPSGQSKSDFIDSIGEKEGFSAAKRFYTKVFFYLNKDLPFEAGTYTFTEGQRYKEAFSNLQGGVVQVPVTFLEGWRVEENAVELSKKTSPDFAKEYFNLTKSSIGTLFPDTYFVDPNSTAQSLLSKQNAEFDEKTANLFNSYTGDLTRDEIIILASIVEREAFGDADRPVIAGILVKRYLQGMPLDADATSQYAAAETAIFPSCLDTNTCDKIDFWPSVSYEDLKTADGYNTRGQLGLPKTPISNPSLASIEAVIKPQSSSYYYYLHDSSGNTYYAVTLDEHIANINKYL
jgi:UPF0755 protein